MLLGQEGLNLEQKTNVEYFAKLETLRFSNRHGFLPKRTIFNLDSLLHSDNFKTRFLNKKGFSTFSFIEVAYAEDDLMQTAILSRDPQINQFYQFILGYDHINHKFYRLKGFLQNEFKLFLSEVKIYYALRNRRVLTDKQFLSDFEVDELDFECLMKAHKKNLSSVIYAKDSYKYDCLIPSASRVIFTEKGERVIR
jgi:hypothetical protein